MSTESNPSRAAGALAAVAMSAWLVACAAAWDRSTVSGGHEYGRAVSIAYEVGKGSRLTPACVMLAAGLAEASIKARVAAYRPTSRVMKAREESALDAWHAGRCPDRALVAIAWGVSNTVRESEDRRRLETELRP